ncbi:cystine/glutamate transporter-like isoform X2 [Thalassophryne amazonica]|uniref:cystine/glutamate transporter-like isoform X2 n=1 Tax=Thalassophryne amazonica TaxID=390379 RepID=UPI001471ADBA|nr:cystine/glutamate transporter-like isoform X2 [Thalassophryne amazonica]
MAGEKTKKQEDEKAQLQLQRQIGLLSAVCLIAGTVVGSGIFIAPKGVLMNSGNSVGLSLLVWTLSGVLSLFGSLCYAELGTTFKKSGAHYTYLLETLGPLPAFLRLWVEFLFIRPAVTSYVALAFGRYVVEPFFAPCAAPTVLVKLVSILGLTLVVAVNCWSVSMASRTQVTLTFIKTFSLILIIVPGVITLSKGQTENFQNGFDVNVTSLHKLPLAFYNGLYAYGGWFYLNFVTEEVINPTRNIPLAVILSMVTVTVFYVLINVAYYTVMTPAEMLLSDTVAVYPFFLVMLITGEIYQLINFASAARWFFIALATLGLLIHRYRFPLHPRPFKVPIVITVIFTVVCFFIVGLSLYSDPWNIGKSLALTLTGVPVYYVTIYRSCLPNKWRRALNYCTKQLQILLEVAQQEVQTY